MSLIVNNRTLATDEEGFLLDPSEWNEDVAAAIAQQENLPLDEQRWGIVCYIRDYFERNQSVPETRTLLKNLKQTRGEAFATRRYLHQLFLYGMANRPARSQACASPASSCWTFEEPISFLRETAENGHGQPRPVGRGSPAKPPP